MKFNALRVVVIFGFTLLYFVTCKLPSSARWSHSNMTFWLVLLVSVIISSTSSIISHSILAIKRNRSMYVRIFIISKTNKMCVSRQNLRVVHVHMVTDKDKFYLTQPCNKRLFQQLTVNTNIDSKMINKSYIIKMLGF